MLPIPTTLEQNAIIPAQGRKGDAGYDLCSNITVTLEPFERALIPTGIHIQIPEGFGGFVLPRSGLAIKKGLSIVNAPGLIDSNFRGEIQVIAINLDSKNSIEICSGDRIAQLVVMKVEELEFKQVAELEESNRGEQGFGSSGV